MTNKVLILHIPVIHRGYVDFFEKYRGQTSVTYILSQEFLTELSQIKPDIASLDEKTVKDLLEKLGFKNISILSKDNLAKVKGQEIVLVQDEISRNLAEKYLPGEKIVWQTVFLRWDKEKVLAEIPLEGIETSQDPNDIKLMKEAYEEAKRSSDWWRQIGLVTVKDGIIIARAYNQGTPNDHAPYQLGSLRDLFKAGEKQEFSPTIHAEQKLIAEAAKNGVSLSGATLYLTHFPCPLCAKLIAWAGLKKVYFSEGASNLDGQIVMKSAGVKILRVEC